MRSLFVHLRLQFQLLLSGIFLWAFLLAGGVPDVRTVVAFLALHIGLYAGTTAYNAYYDQDRGPVTGLRRPPPATRSCRDGGLALMAAGAVASAWVSGPFAAVYAAIALLGIGYSHPRVRFKNGPASSLAVVAFGQGALGSAAGAVAASAPGLPGLDRPLVLGGAAATLLVTGLYPLTQVFQIREDAARGDRTFAVRFGPRGVFATAIACFGLALATAIPAALAVFAPFEVAGLAVALVALLVLLVVWWRRYDPGATLANHDRVFGFTAATSGCFVLVVVRHLVERLR